LNGEDRFFIPYSWEEIGWLKEKEVFKEEKSGLHISNDEKELYEWFYFPEFKKSLLISY
jgi:hypothetical protein